MIGEVPQGFPAYAGHPRGVVCRYKNCGHVGGRGAPATMECRGRKCSCPCCRFLSGRLTYGMSYGPPEEDPDDIVDPDSAEVLKKLSDEEDEPAKAKNGKRGGKKAGDPPGQIGRAGRVHRLIGLKVR